VIRLLKWLLMNSQEAWPSHDKVRKAIMRLPKKKSFVPDLESMCEQLAKRGDTKAIEMKTEIRREFVED
jgi:hypothetical protein